MPLELFIALYQSILSFPICPVEAHSVSCPLHWAQNSPCTPQNLQATFLCLPWGSFPCNLFSSLWLGSLLILAIWRSWVPWNYDLMFRISHRPLSIAKLPGPRFDIPQKEKEQNFHMKIHENFVHLLLSIVLFNDLEDSGVGSTVKQMEDDMQEIRERRERRLRQW